MFLRASGALLAHVHLPVLVSQHLLDSGNPSLTISFQQILLWLALFDYISYICFCWWYRRIIQENTRILVIQRKGVLGRKILQSPPNIHQEGTKYLFCLIRYKKKPTEIELWSPFPRSQEERKDVHQYIIPMWPSLLVGSRCADYDLTFKGSDD